MKNLNTNALENLKLDLENHVLIVTMNRPKALNALNNQTLDELQMVFDYVSKENDIYGVIITGEGRGFVAGADIVQMQPYRSEQGRDYAGYAQATFNKIEALNKPVIAAVNGFALGGGCELSMACDIRLASEKARFGQPEVGLGITPGFSGTQRLPRRVGVAKAKELIFSGKQIGAEEAKRIGLVNEVYAAEELLNKAVEMAKSFTANAPIAVKYSKACIDRGMQMDIDNGIALENELFAMCFATEDQKEGMGAFLEKRKEKHFQNK